MCITSTELQANLNPLRWPKCGTTSLVGCRRPIARTAHLRTQISGPDAQFCVPYCRPVPSRAQNLGKTAVPVDATVGSPILRQTRAHVLSVCGILLLVLLLMFPGCAPNRPNSISTSSTLLFIHILPHLSPQHILYIARYERSYRASV
jgi:hypothetical protein